MIKYDPDREISAWAAGAVTGFARGFVSSVIFQHRNGEIPKPDKTRPPYFRLPNLDPNTSAQGGTFAPEDLLPTKNKK